MSVSDIVSIAGMIIIAAGAVVVVGALAQNRL